MSNEEKAAAVLKATKAGMELPKWQSDMLMKNWKSKGAETIIDHLYRKHCEGTGEC